MSADYFIGWVRPKKAWLGLVRQSWTDKSVLGFFVRPKEAKLAIFTPNPYRWTDRKKLHLNSLSLFYTLSLHMRFSWEAKLENIKNLDRYIDNFTDSQQQGVDAWPCFEAWRQQWTCAGPGCEAWEEKGAQISIWCVGQKYGDSKCRMNNHIYYQDRTYLSFNLHNRHDWSLVLNAGGYLANVHPRLKGLT